MSKIVGLKTNTQFQIHHADRLTDAPREVLNAALEAHLRLRQMGQSDSPVVLGYEQAMWATSAEVSTLCVGGMLLQEDEEESAWWVALVWTHPEYRRCGVMRELWAAMIRSAVQLEIRHVRVMVHRQNDAMNEAMKYFGRHEYNQYVWEVPRGDAG